MVVFLIKVRNLIFYNRPKTNLVLLHFTGKLQCMDGVVVGNICYKMLYKVGSGVNFEEANSLCSFHGATLAEIPTQQVYEAILNYMKKSWFFEIGQSYIYISGWLGSLYSVSSNKWDQLLYWQRNAQYFLKELIKFVSQ